MVVGGNEGFVAYMMNLFYFSGEKQMRRSAQFLGSFGKQTAQLLPTFLLTINGLGKKCEKEKNCAVGAQCSGILFGGGTVAQEIPLFVRASLHSE